MKNFLWWQSPRCTRLSLVAAAYLGNGEALHKPFLEIIPVFRQNRFQSAAVQKMQIHFQLGHKSSRIIAIYRFSFTQKRFFR